MNERWRKLQGFPAYDVSDQGRVRSYWKMGACGGYSRARKPRMLKLGAHVHGYPAVSLYTHTRWEHHEVHTLVTRAFIGRCPKGLEVRHLDGNPSNNAVRNLRYGTRKQNMADIKRYGGRCGAPPKFSDALIAEIRAAAAEAAEGQKAIANRYGVSQGLVSMINTGKHRP